MGRHSAPDEDGPDDDAATLTLAREAEPATGRHASVDQVEPTTVDEQAAAVADDEQATVVIPADQARREKAAAEKERDDRKAAAKQQRDEAKADAKQRRDEAKADAKQRRDEAKADATRARLERQRARRQTGTRADLRMLRHSTALRVQCLAVVVIAFGGYTAVMLGLGRNTHDYLLWIWIPIVLSGVLVGACLDLAHRRATPRKDD
jgi:type IV secretory pathway VirB10-like protein